MLRDSRNIRKTKIIQRMNLVISLREICIIIKHAVNHEKKFLVLAKTEIQKYSFGFNKACLQIPKCGRGFSQRFIRVRLKFINSVKDTSGTCKSREKKQDKDGNTTRQIGRAS